MLDPSKSLFHSIERFEKAEVIGRFQTEELVKIQIFEGPRLVTLELSLETFNKLFTILTAIANAVPVSGMVFSLTKKEET